MPFLTGLQVAKKCKEAQISTKIIIITFEKSEGYCLVKAKID